MLPKWNLADIRSRMFNRPLMVSRDKALDALGAMGPRLNVGALVFNSGEASQSLDQLKAHAAATKAQMDGLPGDGDLKKYAWVDGMGLVERDPYEIWNSVAVFQVRGTLMAENGIDPASGATGYDGLSFKARHALQNAAVRGAILDIDSGGGEVVDLDELAVQLRAFAAEKPLRAIVRGSAASAAYMLAACAGPGNITAAPYSVVGSIGAIMLHADFSKQLESEGVDVTMITSADHKADGSHLKPLDAEVQAKLQGMVTACADQFIDRVSEYREVDRAAIVDQQAAFFSGQEALSLGLVDKFMSWDDSMREFAQIVNGAPVGRAATAPTGARSQKGIAMSTINPAPAAEQQPENMQASIDAARTDGHAAGLAAGVTAERERFAALAELDSGSKISAELSAAITAGTSVADFALGQARAKAAKTSAALDAAAADAVQSGDLPQGSARAGAPAQKPTANRGQAFVERQRAAAAARG